MGSICHGYMCILLYMKLIWSSGVMVLHRSILIWRGIHLQGYMCILLYVKLIWCNGVA